MKTLIAAWWVFSQYKLRSGLHLHRFRIWSHVSLDLITTLQCIYSNMPIVQICQSEFQLRRQLILQASSKERYEQIYSQVACAAHLRESVTFTTIYLCFLTQEL